MRYPIALISLLGSLYGCGAGKVSEVPNPPAYNQTTSDNKTMTKETVDPKILSLGLGS
jgi:hypothetical protein